MVHRHFNNNYVIDEEPKKNRSRRRRHTHTNKNQSAMDGWADYKGKVTIHEDLFPEDNTSPEEEVYHQQRVTLTPRIKKKRRQKSRLLPQN
jgi:hypothetical protein